MPKINVNWGVFWFFWKFRGKVSMKFREILFLVDFWYWVYNGGLYAPDSLSYDYKPLSVSFCSGACFSCFYGVFVILS